MPVVIKSLLYSLLGLAFLASLALAYSMIKGTDENEAKYPSVKCTQDDVVRVRLDDRVFEIPRTLRLSITVLDENNEPQSTSRYGCYRPGDKPIDIVYMQINVTNNNPFGQSAKHPADDAEFRVVILGIGYHNHMLFAQGKLDAPKYSCRSYAPTSTFSRCVVEHMYSDNIRVLWEIIKRQDARENELESYARKGLEYIQNLEVTD